MEGSIIKITQKYIQKYQENIKSEYPAVDMKMLQKIWSDLNFSDNKKQPVESKSSTKKKKTAYQTYFVEARQRLTEENPSLKFGEISKLVSSEWSNMSSQEKKKYEQEKVDPVKKPSNEMKYDDNCFIDFFENPTEKDNFRFDLENDALEEESILEEELEEDVDEEDDVYFDDENTFEMDD